MHRTARAPRVSRRRRPLWAALLALALASGCDGDSNPDPGTAGSGGSAGMGGGMAGGGGDAGGEAGSGGDVGAGGMAGGMAGAGGDGGMGGGMAGAGGEAGMAGAGGGECVDGRVDCPCGPGDSCDAGSTCTDGTCVSCLDQIGCSCTDACAGALACDADTNACRVAITCEELVCGRGRLCADEDGRDGACLDECEEGYEWDSIQRRCNEVATCVSLDCAGQGRVCDEGGETPVCGGCLDGYEEVGGECARAGGCEGPAGIGEMCSMLNRTCEEDGDGIGSCGNCDEGYFPDRAEPDGACIAAEGVCSIEADCPEGFICAQLEAPNGGAAVPAGACVAAPCPDGQVFDNAAGACVDVAAEIVERCAAEGSVGVWPVTDFDGNAVCQTAPGYFFDTTPAVRAAVPCDADSDGWVRRSAQGELDAEDLARQINARCDLRTVFGVALVNEWGQQRVVDLPDGIDSVALYEPDGIDVDGDPGGLQEGPYGARIFTGAEANPLTKACVGRRTDLNSNGIDDLVETHADLPPDERGWMVPFLSFGYFTELYTSRYEPPLGALVHGTLIIEARSRCDLGFPLGYEAADDDWWRSCTRRRASTYGPAAGAGYDFAEYACDAAQGDCAALSPRTGAEGADGAYAHGVCFADQLDDDRVAWRPMGHFSQFKCAEVVAEAAEPEGHQVRHTDLYTGGRGHWQVNRCGLGEGADSLSCESDLAVALDAAQRGGATETLVDQVMWLARRYSPYADEAAYPGGCINEWVESPDLCAGNGVAGAADSNRFGRVVCGCDDPEFQVPLADNQVGACAGNLKECVNGRLLEPVPNLEVCNGEDTDCDGTIDEGLTNRCGGCGALPAEVCNNIDDDCDGTTDEGIAGLDERCAEGVGECRRSGFTICAEDGSVVCDAQAANPSLEGCDRNADYDCDGAFGEGTAEVCDGGDNDCDGNADEEMVADWTCAPSVRAVLIGDAIDGIVDPTDPRLIASQRSVRFDRNVLISQVEETTANFNEVASANQWDLLAEGGNCQSANNGQVCPARINWYGAVAYANARSIAEGYDPCYRMVNCQNAPSSGNFTCDYVTWDETLDCSGYRLPTSSEWEYAARAAGNYEVQSGQVEILDVAWCGDNNQHWQACDSGLDHPWELCDVYGNLGEWVWDEYGPPPIERVTCDAGGCTVDNEYDYLGPSGDSQSGTNRMLAGGHAQTDDYACGPTARDDRSPISRNATTGVRLARTANTENRNPEHLVDGDTYDFDALFDARGRAEIIFDIEAIGDADYFKFTLSQEAYVSIETIGLASSWTVRNGNDLIGLVNPSATGGAVQCDFNAALSLFRSSNGVRLEPAIATDTINQGAGLCALIDDYDPRGDANRSRLPAGEYQVKVEGQNRGTGTARLIVRKLQVAIEGETCSAAAVYPSSSGLAYPPCLDGLTCFEGSVIGGTVPVGSLTDDKGMCVAVAELPAGITDSNIPAGQLDVWQVTMAEAGRLGVETLAPEGVNCTVQRDTELRIYRSNNGVLTEIAYDDNGGLGYCSRIDTPVAAGTYFVVVNVYDHGFALDSYRLRLGGTTCAANDNSAPCNSCPQGTEVPLGYVCAPAGQFNMGAAADAGRPQYELPQHQVTITRPFLMQSTEVTRGAWESLMGTTPWTNPSGDPDNLFCDSGCPVYHVSWWEAAAYANALSAAEGLQECYDLSSNWLRWDTNNNAWQRDGTCADLHTRTIPVWEYIFDGLDYAVPMWWDFQCIANPPFIGLGCTGYRLPTEAEWEYAARAGTNTTWFFGDNEAALDQYAWYRDSAGQRAHVVGELLPNPWGLYDIYGNVSEWTNDFHFGGNFDWDGYPGGERQDPTGGAYPDVYRRNVARGDDRWYGNGVNREDTDYYRAHRGGAFDYEADPQNLGRYIAEDADATDTVSSARHALQMYYRMRTVGFRLVRTVGQ